MKEKKESFLLTILFILILVEGIFLAVTNSEIKTLNVQLKDQSDYFELKIKTLETQLTELKNVSDENFGKLQKNLDLISEEVKGVQKESLEKIKKVQEEVSTSNGDFSKLIQETLPAVVSIKANTGVGSGVIIHPDGYVITNYHVIKDAMLADLTTYDGSSHKINIVATDANSDLAILQITAENKKFHYLEFADKIIAGERVLALGNPGGLEFSVAEGIISATERPGPNGILYIQSDVPINPGNSGGPLINKQGQIIGINTLKVKGFEGVGFAVHYKVAKEMVDKTLKGKLV
ncbi:trypsin-like peptidase domain-containing protein [Candidatus Woesearchaeota archaeon]|nr:trypsin-like peptidase domain-containing protein [Candidatus Woesearchaeota archaeon]